MHGHAIFGVVSDTGTGTTRRIPMSGECLFFFASPTWLRRGSDTLAVKKKSQMSDLWPLPAAAALRRSPELDRADRRAPPLSFFFFFCFFFVFFFFALSPRCLLSSSLVHFNFSNTVLYFLFVLCVFCQPHESHFQILTIEYHRSVMMPLICHHFQIVGGFQVFCGQQKQRLQLHADLGLNFLKIFTRTYGVWIIGDVWCVLTTTFFFFFR